jgi:hypothetical protein
VPVWNSGTKRSSDMVYRHIPAHFEYWLTGYNLLWRNIVFNTFCVSNEIHRGEIYPSFLCILGFAALTYKETYPAIWHLS